MRQLFYLLMILNLLLFLWIYPTEQQPHRLQTGHPAIGNLNIVSEPVMLIKSDPVTDGEVEQESVLQTVGKPLSPALASTPGAVEPHVEPSAVIGKSPASIGRESDDEQWKRVEEREKVSRRAVTSKPEKSKNATATIIEQSTPKKGWIFQAGSFAQKSNADNLLKSINKSGMNAYIEKIRVQDIALYRVRVGPFENKSEAQHYLKMVEKKFDLKGTIIKRASSIEKIR